MLTTGSSGYNPLQQPPTGWIPMLRKNKVTADQYVAVVTHVRGGEEILASADPPIHT